MSLRDTYNKIAQDWHQDHLQDDWWVDGAEKFSSLMPAGGSILDAGCAGGTKSKFFAAKGFQVMGIDFAPNFIEIAKREVPEASFQVLDIREIGSLEKEFDGIFLQAVLLHFSKKEVPEILKDALTKLRAGGYIHVSVKEIKEGQPEEEIWTENDYGYEYERFFSYFSQEELENILKKLGLNIISSKVHQTGKTRWIQVAAQK